MKSIALARAGQRLVWRQWGIGPPFSQKFMSFGAPAEVAVPIGTVLRILSVGGYGGDVAFPSGWSAGTRTAALVDEPYTGLLFDDGTLIALQCVKAACVGVLKLP